MTRDQAHRLSLACIALTLVVAGVGLSAPTAGSVAMIGATVAVLALLLTAPWPTGHALRPALAKRARRF